MIWFIWQIFFYKIYNTSNNIAQQNITERISFLIINRLMLYLAKVWCCLTEPLQPGTVKSQSLTCENKIFKNQIQINNPRQRIKPNLSHLTWSAWGWRCSRCHNLHYLHIWYEPCQTLCHTGWPGLCASHFLSLEQHRPPPLTETDRK